MLKLYFCSILFLLPGLLSAQYTLSVKVVDATTREPLPGANIILTGTAEGSSTNKDGIAEIKNIAEGNYKVKATFIGYRDTLFNISLSGNIMITLELTPEQEALEEVIVSSTRTNMRIEDLPLKVEVLGLDEMNEESTLVPGNISSILGDLAIITIQRTNPINGNDAIRMQGLDPRYTLIARDGLPLYGGFSGSLGVLSIPPLDLKQVEIIKGSVSTLYGGGAIAGMINIISKTPQAEPQRQVLLNVTTLKEKNINTFFSGKNDKIGYTLFAGANLKEAADVNGDDFSEVPEDYNYIIHPKVFLYLNKKSQLDIGLTTTFDRRRSGDMVALKDGPDPSHPFLRKDNTNRHVLEVQYSNTISGKHLLTVKSSANIFQRDFSYPGLAFDGIQYSSYTEVSDRITLPNHTIVAGINIITEKFDKQGNELPLITDYNYVTDGFFIQDDWTINSRLTLESGLRYDHINTKRDFLLPRVALYYKPSPSLSLRLASGAGYKAPNFFSYAEPVPNLNSWLNSVRAELSFGVNADIQYHTILWNEVSVNLNQAFYLVRIYNPIVITGPDTNPGNDSFTNWDNQLMSLGTDTYMVMTFKNAELYLGYNHTYAVEDNRNSRDVYLPFNPTDKFSTTFAYEVAEKWRTGIEGSLSANQHLYFNKPVPNIWFFAAMVERKFSFGSLVVNVENLTDARQSTYEPLVEGTTTDPIFHPIWGPVEGRVFNLSLKVVVR